MIPALHILALLETPGVGRKTVHRLLVGVTAPTIFPDGYIARLESVKQAYPRTKVPSADALSEGMVRAERLLRASESQGVRTVAYFDQDYPSLLKRISDPPVLLFAKGDLSRLRNRVVVAVVGTRKPTPRGAKVAKNIGRKLAELEVAVVSGLALGCDTAGHEGCLDGNGYTVAVLAHGLDTIYPPQGVALAERIVAAGGCLISEYPVGTPIMKSRFVERDRLQSGMSHGVIVIETDVDGGSMHTARFCMEQRRTLGYLVPYPSSTGNLPQTRGIDLIMGYGDDDNCTVPILNMSDVSGYVRLCQLDRLCPKPGDGQGRLFDMQP